MNKKIGLMVVCCLASCFVSVLAKAQPGDRGTLVVTNNASLQPVGMAIVASTPTCIRMAMIPGPQMVADADLTFNNPTAEVVQATTEVAQNGETTLPDGSIVPIPDRSELKLVNKQMQDVCDDPANKWVLAIPHVVKCNPTILCELGPDGEALPAVGIIVDREENIESVKRKVPSILGGFPTQFWPDYMEVE